MMDKIEKMMMEEWRQLGFYYDLDDRISVNQWRFYGSKSGLESFVNMLDEYTKDRTKQYLTEHDHYGPYSYLKIITLEGHSCITNDGIGGTITDLKALRNIIADKLISARPGQTFNIDKDFGTSNT